MGHPEGVEEPSHARMVARARHRRGNPGGSLHWLDAARLRWTSGRAARDYSLAFPRLDARILSHRHRRVRQTFRPRRQSIDLCRDLSGHRHVAQSRGELLRRGNSQGHRSAHGISLSRKRCAPNPDLSLTALIGTSLYAMVGSIRYSPQLSESTIDLT